VRPAPKAPTPATRRPWADYGLRLLFSTLLALACFQLLAQSTFAWRMREDIPTGVGGIAAALAAILGFLPLAFGRRYLGAYVVCGGLAAALGAHWWSTIPWEELITETNFQTDQPPGLWDYAMVVSPAFLSVSYAALSRWSALRADLLARGAEPAQASQAAAGSFLGGALALVATSLAGGAFIALLLGGLAAPRDLFGVPAVVGVVLAALVVAAAVALFGRRWPRWRDLRRPSSPEEGRAAPEQNPGQRWPS
jgi:hypothetical protein